MKLIIIGCDRASKSEQVLQFFSAQGLFILDTKPKICSFLHPRESIRGPKSVKDSQELTRSQLASVTLLLPS